MCSSDLEVDSHTRMHTQDRYTHTGQIHTHTGQIHTHTGQIHTHRTDTHTRRTDTPIHNQTQMCGWKVSGTNRCDIIPSQQASYGQNMERVNINNQGTSKDTSVLSPPLSSNLALLFMCLCTCVFLFTFTHLADTFIQSDLQERALQKCIGQ